MPEKLKHTIPGGPARVRPIYHEGVYYDPLHPPKIVYSGHGDTELLGGKRLTRDETNSMLFWARKQPENLRQSMLESLKKAKDEGTISSFVDFDTDNDIPTLKQESREKLSAYRVMASEMGIFIGPFYLHKESGTVSATILLKENTT